MAVPAKKVNLTVAEPFLELNGGLCNFWLTHLLSDRMAAISQAKFSNAPKFVPKV